MAGIVPHVIADRKLSHPKLGALGSLIFGAILLSGIDEVKAKLGSEKFAARWCYRNKKPTTNPIPQEVVE